MEDEHALQPAPVRHLATEELYDASAEYAGEIETHYWTPDKSNKPDKKIRLDMRTQVLKSSDLNRIQRQWNEIRALPDKITFLQNQLVYHEPPRAIVKLRRELSEIRDSDYEDADAAEEARDAMQARIDYEVQTYAAEHERLQSKLNELTSSQTAWDFLRLEIFNKVLADHSIGWEGVKVDFASGQPEPSDGFITALYFFVMEVLNRGKAPRKNGGSRK